ncbi:hypothetical protein RxyAA322_27970 [Rubrobacter xylanophilus]|uniref:Uncharacterized protein n=1 Tax=Rubrobacter xylanophilus TaxID=49319 RepID=A0A510HPT3_9ACTN|nr:hypothetical protein RxyAA322_27970 [Rubrobacter xylanophilus]
MPWHNRVQKAINTAMPFLAPTQTTNLSLLVSATLKKQTEALALHRCNERVDAREVQPALAPYTTARLGFPPPLGPGHRLDDVRCRPPSGSRMRYQVLKIAIPLQRAGAAPLQPGYDRDHLPACQEPEPAGAGDSFGRRRGAACRGSSRIVLADRGFHRTGSIAWLEHHRLDYVVCIKKGSCITEEKMGAEGSWARKG